MGNPILRYAIAFVVISGALAAAWAPFAPLRLFDFDAANFAMALEYFAPAAHQPQPPGYPLYVGLTQLVHVFVPDVAITFLIAGIIGSAAAVVLLWALGEMMFGLTAGVCAALLLATNPILWQTAMSDQVRIYIAVISIGVALVVWPGWATSLTPRRFAAAGFVLGVLTGFRPEMVVSMGPLAMVAAVRSRLKLPAYLLSAIAVAVGMAPWLIFLLIRVGGFSGFIAMMRVYSATQAATSSVLFGASSSGALKMVTSAFWWLSLGIVSWLPALLLVRWRRVRANTAGQMAFIAVWFISLFAFSIAIHIAASGHALGFIPVACVVGGWVLSAVGDSYGRIAMGACLVLALSLNVYFFFHPYARQVREASYPVVEAITSMQEVTLDRLDTVLKKGEVFIVSDDNWVRWRILEYYYPDNLLLYIPAPFANPNTRIPVWMILNRMRMRDIDPKSDIRIPACGTIAWVVNDRFRQDLIVVNGADEDSHVVTTPGRAGIEYRLGRYHLVSSPELCGQKK